MKFQLLRSISEPLDVSLPPGGHVAVGSPASAVGRTGIALRRSGLEIRDSLVMLGPGAESTTVFLARKPLIGTVAANVLAHGCGVLNIDGCRIFSGTEHFVSGVVSRSASGAVEGADEREGAALGMYASGSKFKPTNHPSGRWPANWILVHTADCVCEGTKRVKATSAHGYREAIRRGGVHTAAKGHQTVGRVQPVTGHADPDGKETVAAWRCAPDCAVARLDAQSRASRFFFQAASLDEAWAWIERLLTMPGEGEE